jgi:hypothetical protein
MENMFDWIMDRMKERSTWLGIIGFITAAGVALTPEQTAAIAAGGMALASLIATFTRDV